MSIFEGREKAAEHEFEQEHEFAFKLAARRNRLLGLWAAGHMGLIGEAAARYAMNLVEAQVIRHDDRAIIKKISDDLIASGVPLAERDVEQRLQVLAAEARAELLNDMGRD